MFYRARHYLNAVLLCLLASASESRALTNNLALTPPMGWNDWNSYHCNVTEADVTNTATIMASNGMAAAGYQFVNIDDGWAGSRDANGVIVTDPGAYPHGIKWLADYVHAKGLKLGIYTDHGTLTCSSCVITNTQKSPGSFDYEYLDAITYAQWGVDYLKDDSCNQPINDNRQADYSRMSDSLMNSGRPIVFSICENQEHYEYWSPDLGNLWRTTGDISSTFTSMIGNVDQNSKAAYLAGPGRWNDADMLEVGNGEFAANLAAAQTHFTLWCIMAAPLLAGNDLTTMTPQTLAILTNAEAIAVDQDPAGEQGIRVGGMAGFGEVWSKPLGYDFTTRAVALINRSTTTATNITCVWTNLGLQAGPATLRDLWAHQDLGTFTDSFSTNVPPESVVFLKVTGTPLSPPAPGTNYLSDLQPVYAYSGGTGWQSVSNDTSIDGNPITLDGVVHPKGIGTHAIGGQEYNLGGICSRFHAVVGVDDEVGANGSVVFQVFADGRKIYDSGIMTGSTNAYTVDLDLTGVQRLTLGVTDTGDDLNGRNFDDDADWADALVVVTNTTPQLPYAPTGLTASSGNAITLAWNNTLAALGYNVKRATNSGGPYSTIANVPVAVFSDTNVVIGANYYYVVSAVSGFGEGSNSVEVAAAPCFVPCAPTNVMATAGNSSVTVCWSASAGATSYNVYRFTGNTPLALIGSGIAATNFTDTPLAAAATNYYVVTAIGACNPSGYSDYAAAVTPPAAPTNLSAVASNALVNLKWAATASGAAFNVKRSLTNGGPYNIIAGNVSGTNYLDGLVANGTTYYYVVSALDVGGEGPNSSQASATPFAPAAVYWTNTVTGMAQNWDVNANWANVASFPDSAGELTVIAANIPAPQTINLDAPITIGSLQIGDPGGSASYTIAANGGSLTLSDTNSLTLTQFGSSAGDVLAAPITITTNLIFVNYSANPLTLAGILSSSGGSLTISKGILQVGDGTTNGSLGSVNVLDNGTLIFNRSDNVTMGGNIAGSGPVAQSGPGILTLNGTDTGSGGTIISSGTLKAGNSMALGLNAGAIVVTNGGTLDLNGNALVAKLLVSGWGVNSNGAIVSSSSSSQPNALQNVTLTGDAALGGPGNWQASGNPGCWGIQGVGASTLTNSGGKPFNLYKVGSNQVSFVGTTIDTNLANIDIQQGMLGFENNATSMGNPSSNLTIRAGATLEFNQQNAIQDNYTKQFVLYGDGATVTITNSGFANFTLHGQMTLNGACLIGGSSGGLLTIGCNISGSGSLTKLGIAPLTLTNNNTYIGSTLVNNSTLRLTGNGSISGSALITVASGATLDASGRADTTLTLTNGQTLGGNGTLNGNVVIGNGAILAPGNFTGRLTFNNNLTLNSGGTTFLELNKTLSTNEVVQVTGALTYGGTLVLTNVSGTLTNGSGFKLFKAGSYGGAFTNIVPAIPAVNLAWNTNNLGSGLVSIVSSPTMPPKFGAMTITGGNNFIFTGSNGVADWTYYLLVSTNLGLPLTNWTIVTTNTFDGGGNFNFTNSFGANPNWQFYRLQLR